MSSTDDNDKRPQEYDNIVTVSAKLNSAKADAPRQILQVDRDVVETTLAGIRYGMVVFVPSKIPSAQAYDRFGRWFEYTDRKFPSNVQIALISSVICEVEESKESRYQAYRVAKLRLEDQFSDSFLVKPQNIKSAMSEWECLCRAL